MALIHYKGKRTQQELLEIANIYKEGALDKFTSSTFEGPSTKKPRLDYFRVTKSISDIFSADPTELPETDISSTEAPKCILIEGAPGIGKTILAREIAYCWANYEILTEIKIVFLLYLRDPQLQSITTIKGLIEYVSMGYFDEQIIAFNRHLVSTNGHQLCIIMDGFDEYPTPLQKNSFIVNIINGVVLPKAMLVITSRPTATVSLHDRVDRRIDILGLPKEEREKYILQTFRNSPEKKIELEKYLKQQPVINGLCFVPLHLAILLYLFQQGSLPETLTEMNESFILHAIYRHLEKHGLTPSGPVDKLANVPKPVLDVVYNLSELAFKGLQENKLVFTFDEIKQTCPCIDATVGAINGFGLLQAVEHYPHKGAGTTTSSNFLHFTMQEFLAAVHVSSLPSEQQSSLMEKTFWDGRYNYMWMMFVGIVGIRSEIFVNFISKGKVYKKKSGVRVAEHILSDKRKRLLVFQCYMEAKSNTAVPKVISDMFKDGNITINKQLLPHHISSLMCFMSNSTVQWKTLELKQCKITDAGMTMLEQSISEKVSTLQYVDLSHNAPSPWGVYCVIIRHCSVDGLTLCGGQGMEKYVNEITESLQTNKSLKFLTLCNIFGNIELIKTIVSGTTTLNEVNLPSREVVNIDDFHQIKESFLFHTTLQYPSNDNTRIINPKRMVKINILCNKSCDSLDLHSLDASQQCIDNYGVTIITTFCEKLKTLTLSSNKISDDGAVAISKYLKSHNCLQELNLALNAIHDDGVKAMSEAIQVNTILQKLDLSNNKVSDDGAIAISSCLKHNISLQNLNISHNNITNKGTYEIAKSIQMNSVLQRINISENFMSIEGLLYFIKAVTSNCTLQVVDITYNNVTRIEFERIKRYIENLQHSVQIFASWNEINEKHELVSKVFKFHGPASNNIKEHIWSFKSRHNFIICLSGCLKEDDTLHDFTLHNKGLTGMEAKIIAEAIQVNKILQKFCISDNIISDDGVTAISNSLKSNSSLQELNLSSNEITSKGAKNIGEAIKVNITLRKLDIHCNKISDDGANAISDALKSNTSLKELDMSSNQITSEGAKKIGEAIKDNTTLQKLKLEHNSVSDDGVITISNGLKFNISLQELNISYNNFASKGAEKIGEAIKANKTLKKLVITNNTICDDGAAAISNGLKCNNSLQELDMSQNEITSEGAKSISEGIKMNTTIHTLNLHQSSIDNALSFNLTILKAINNSVIHLTLPPRANDGDRNLIYNEVQKIHKERERQGIRKLNCTYWWGQ